MKLVSTMALGAALACGGAAMVATPALAKKKEDAAQPSLSKPVRDALLAAQTAMKTNDAATAKAAITPALAAASNPDEKLYVGDMLYHIGLAEKDTKDQSAGIDLMLSSGKVAGPQLMQMYAARGQMAYAVQDYRNAETSLKGAIAAGDTEPDDIARLADSQAKQGRPAEALATLQSAADAAAAKGTKLPADFYSRGINIGYQAKLAGPVQKLSETWVSNYPTPDNWRDSLEIYRTLNHVDADYDLDISRLQRAAGALKGEKDYYDYASQIYLRYPGEAKAVIEEGIAKGYLNGAAGADIQSMLAAVNKRITADKADLPGASAAAAKAATGKNAFATADAYLGYGDYAKAIPLYRLALQKGGVDANVVNTRLGMALARSGDKAGAKQAFGAVTGARMPLAQYWMIWMNQQA